MVGCRYNPNFFMGGISRRIMFQARLNKKEKIPDPT
jgi:hypothetical protein